MQVLSPLQRPVWPRLAWSSAALAGVVAPAGALLLLGADAAAGAGAAILAVGLMGAGIIAAAAAARFWLGVVLALLSGAGLLMLAQAVGMPPLQDPLWFALAIATASLSFAARGALFARSGEARGWLIAVFVVAGEAAILATAAARPEALPEWLLALLPAQWASMAIAGAWTGMGAGLAGAALVALAGTAAATLLVARLWPRRWPYLVMFTAWLALSALVYEQM
ncbi:hypothetical protein [Porphyrobacter sp. YT40]|uniref:hypothetical protein n=1 Tax=Porphyrobacter sp. YT40 TaxID=2547601 RepID=UPI0015E8DA6C|nr:hypothetical protein [Porphyrobacter sp. YT40]